MARNQWKSHYKSVYCTTLFDTQYNTPMFAAGTRNRRRVAGQPIEHLGSPCAELIGRSGLAGGRARGGCAELIRRSGLAGGRARGGCAELIGRSGLAGGRARGGCAELIRRSGLAGGCARGGCAEIKKHLHHSSRLLQDHCYADGR
ncbi:UNVERIFIED_CONTAM: hypothetical protein FKN15_038738 [Acipenser sinensis]